MKEIAQNPENRFDTWILKTWRVLPTNPDFINLTEEQREWLWQDYLLDNPEIAKKIAEANDTEFQEEWDKMDKENPDEEFREESYGIDIAEKFNEFVKETEIDDIQRSPAAQAILDKMKEKQSEAINNNPDWEEVDLDSKDWEEVDD